MKRLAVVALLLTSGCALQVGKHVGGAPSPGRVTHGGEIAAYTAPWTAGGFGMPHLGVEAAAEVEHQVDPSRRYLGSRFTMGGQVGWSYWLPDSRLSVQGHFDSGMALFASPYDAYLGATLAMPIEIGPLRDVTDMNHAFQFVARRLSLVPYVRWRSSWNDALWIHDTAGGLAVRARLSTDLL